MNILSKILLCDVQIPDNDMNALIIKKYGLPPYLCGKNSVITFTTRHGCLSIDRLEGAQMNNNNILLTMTCFGVYCNSLG